MLCYSETEQNGHGTVLVGQCEGEVETADTN